MKILSAIQMAEVDRLTTERYLIPSILLMDNAGRSIADEIQKACSDINKKSIIILCGRGNNGGDGFVVARYLALRKANPSILLFSEPGKLKGDALINFQIAQAMGIPIKILATPAEAKAHLRKSPAPDVIVDALFGTGLSKPIGPDYRHIIEWVNACFSKSLIVAVDIPSGLMADSFELHGPAVKAHLTITFSALKLAQIIPPAADFVGKLVLAQIGSPSQLYENFEYRMNLIDPELVQKVLSFRMRSSHKGTFGHVHVVAGARGKSGAALMTGMAALRSGAGLVTVWLPRSVQRGAVGKFPELMTEWLPDTDEETSDRSGAERVLNRLSEAETLVLGPGLTTHPSTRRLIWELARRSPVPVVLDADGINAFVAPAEPLRNENGQPIIITPHPGEMARLVGKSVPEIQKNRFDAAQDCAARYRCYVILKGFQTVIASPAGDVYINNTGNPGMATGGTGDILSGITGRFVAEWQIQTRNKKPANILEYLSTAVYLHGLAGDLAAEEEGMESLVATDLLTYLPKAFKRTSAE